MSLPNLNLFASIIRTRQKCAQHRERRLWRLVETHVVCAIKMCGVTCVCDCVRAKIINLSRKKYIEIPALSLSVCARAPRAARPRRSVNSCPTNGTRHPLPRPSTVRLQVSTRINATNHRLREYSGAVCSDGTPSLILDTLSLR